MRTEYNEFGRLRSIDRSIKRRKKFRRFLRFSNRACKIASRCPEKRPIPHLPVSLPGLLLFSTSPKNLVTFVRFSLLFLIQSDRWLHKKCRCNLIHILTLGWLATFLSFYYIFIVRSGLKMTTGRRILTQQKYFVFFRMRWKIWCRHWYTLFNMEHWLHST